jgi:hypothetical protein
MDRQLARLAAGFGVAANEEFLTRMVDEALVPGRTTDLDFLSRPESARGIGFGNVPPIVAGQQRVIGLFVTPIGLGDSVVGHRTRWGITALTSLQAGASEGVLSPAIVPRNGAADFVVTDPMGVAAKTLLTIDAESLKSLDAVHVIVDTATMTATGEPLNLEQLAALSSYDVISLQSLKAGYEAQLVPSTSVGQVDFLSDTTVTS